MSPSLRVLVRRDRLDVGSQNRCPRSVAPAAIPRIVAVPNNLPVFPAVIEERRVSLVRERLQCGHGILLSERIQSADGDALEVYFSLLTVISCWTEAIYVRYCMSQCSPIAGL